MKPMWIDVEREAAGITIDPELGYHIRRAAQERWMADAARSLTVQAAHHTMYRRHLALANVRERNSLPPTRRTDWIVADPLRSTRTRSSWP